MIEIEEKKLLLTNAIAIFALFVSFVSLIWNIIRDLIKDKTKIKFSISIGQIHLIKNQPSGVFIPIASETDQIIKPQLLINITNIGRRNIVIERVSYLNKLTEKGLHHTIVVSGLPIKLEPYGVFSFPINFKDDLLKDVKEENIKRIWVEDTSCKKWYLGRKNLKIFKELIEIYFKKKSIQEQKS